MRLGVAPSAEVIVLKNRVEPSALNPAISSLRVEPMPLSLAP
jgi:hypothetical protein